MFLVQYKWSPRLVVLGMVLALVVGSGSRLHAQTRIIGATNLPPKTINVLQTQYGYFRGEWRRWPGTPTTRPKKTRKKPSSKPEVIPTPKQETSPAGEFPDFPLKGFGDDVPGGQPGTRPFPPGEGSLPAPFDPNSDPAPAPSENLKQIEPERVDTLPPLNDPNGRPFGTSPSPTLPDDGAATSPRNRDYEVRRAMTTRPGYNLRQSPAARYPTGRSHVLRPATLHAPLPTRADRPTYRRNPQGRYDNPLRSGMRTANVPQQQAVPVANWSARDERRVHRAEPIRTSAAPRVNPLRR